MKNRRKSNLFGCLHEFRQFFFITLLSVLSVNLYAQQRGIQGVVVDGNGETIIGANVLSEDGKAGVITDLDGNFKLDVPVGTNIKISYIGYKTKVLKATAGNMRIVLLEDSEMLAEVEVVAYGVQKKVTVTGALSSVKTDDLVRTPVSSVNNVLAGQLSGVTTVQYSGEPGSDAAKIFVRGQGTWADSERSLGTWGGRRWNCRISVFTKCAFWPGPGGVFQRSGTWNACGAAWRGGGYHAGGTGDVGHV